MQKKWYETFFSGVALEFWRRCVTPELTCAEVEFLESALAMPKGGRVLDIPCGNGRHAGELAARGYRVTGVDLAAEFVEEARARCPEAKFVEGDMHAIRYEDEFDGAFCFGNSFGYAGYEESCEFLAAVGRALKPGARFAIDTGLAAESILPTRVPQRWIRVNGRSISLKRNRSHEPGMDCSVRRDDALIATSRGPAANLPALIFERSP